jgi:hypothetical protein
MLSGLMRKFVFDPSILVCIFMLLKISEIQSPIIFLLVQLNIVMWYKLTVIFILIGAWIRIVVLIINLYKAWAWLLKASNELRKVLITSGVKITLNWSGNLEWGILWYFLKFQIKISFCYLFNFIRCKECSCLWINMRFCEILNVSADIDGAGVTCFLISLLIRVAVWLLPILLKL